MTLFRRIRGLAARHWLVLFAGLLGAVAVLSLTPQGGAGDPGGADKPLHLLAYGAVAAPVGLAWPPRAWIWLGVAALVGGGIELIQPAVGREGHWDDLAANLAGIAAGAVLGAGLRRI